MLTAFPFAVGVSLGHTPSRDPVRVSSDDASGHGLFWRFHWFSPFSAFSAAQVSRRRGDVARGRDTAQRTLAGRRGRKPPGLEAPLPSPGASARPPRWCRQPRAAHTRGFHGSAQPATSADVPACNPPHALHTVGSPDAADGSLGYTYTKVICSSSEIQLFKKRFVY